MDIKKTDRNKCFLCDLVETSRSKNLKTLFENKKNSNFDKYFLTSDNYNTYTHQNSAKNEIKNEYIKSNNLVIFGMDESYEADNEAERQVLDKLKVENLLVSINIDASEEIVEVKRLNYRKNTILSRPLLIRFDNYYTRTIILKSAKLLKDSCVYKNIAISPDYSRFKRMKIKLLIQTKIELNRQLKDISLASNFYFSIKCGKIQMINKQMKEQNATLRSEILNYIDGKLEQLENMTNVRYDEHATNLRDIEEKLTINETKLETINDATNSLNAELGLCAESISNLQTTVNETSTEVSICAKNISNFVGETNTEIKSSLASRNQILMNQISTLITSINQPDGRHRVWFEQT